MSQKIPKMNLPEKFLCDMKITLSIFLEPITNNGFVMIIANLT